MRSIGKREQGWRTIVPGLTSIETADDAADFERGIDVPRITGVGHQANHAHRERHAHRPSRRHDRQLPPTLATVVTTIDRRWSRSKIQDLGIVWMKDDRPHHSSLLRKREALPMFPAIGAAIRTMLSANINNPRIAWMDGDRAHFNFVGEASGKMPPLNGADFLTKKAAKQSRACSGSPLWDADIHILSHRLPSLYNVARCVAKCVESRSQAVFPPGI